MPEDTTAPRARRTGPKVVDLGDGAKGDRAQGQGAGAKAKAAPSATAAATGDAKRRSPADRKLAQSIAGIYQGAGVALIGIGMQTEDQGLAATGAKTVNNAETIAEAWLDYADQNAKVKQALRKFTEGTALGVLVVSHVALLIPLAASRGVIPPNVAAMMDTTPGAAQNGNGGGPH